MIRLLTIASLILAVNYSLFGQNKRPYKCGFVIKDYKQLKYNFDNYSKHFNCQSGEKIASIGSSNGAIEVLISIFTDSIAWTLQDIDTACLNQKELTNVIAYHEKLKKSKINSTFDIQIGNESKTNLRPNHYDRIILSNVFHELSDAKSIMVDIYNALTRDGELVIKDAVTNKQGQKRKDCGHLMLNETDFLTEMTSYGFMLVKRENPNNELITYFTFRLIY
jgi:hypothetical protein